MLPNDAAFSILKNKRAMAQAAAQPGQQNLTQPSPQNNLEGENAGLQSEVSQFIQRLEHKQKELAAREKQREKYEKERQDMMHPDQQTLPQAPALPQPDQDIQQVANENQQQHEQGLGFKRSILEEMEMLGMIRKDDEPPRGVDGKGEHPYLLESNRERSARYKKVFADAKTNPDHPVKTNPTSYDMDGQPIQGDREIDDHGQWCEHCDGGTVAYTDDGAVGCSTEDCIANTSEMLQEGGGYPQYKNQNLTQQQVGVVMPTRTEQTEQDDGSIRIDAPQPKIINQYIDEQGNPSTTAQGMRHPDIRTGEPMDIVMRLLKRQTELGEHHEDLPSSHGPVVRYHGTKGDEAQEILQGKNQGLKDVDDRSITDDPNEALSYGVERSNHRSGSTERAQEMYASAPAMVGVRRNAPMPQHYGRSHGMRSRNDFPDALHYGGAVDRKYLTPVNTNQFDRRATIQNRNDRGDITDRTMNYPPVSQNQNQKAQARFKEGQPGYKKPDIFGWDEKRNFPADDKPDLDGRFYTHEQEWNNQNNQRAIDNPRVAHLNRFNKFRKRPSEAQMNYKPYNPQPAPVQQPADPQQQQLPIQTGEPMDIVMRLLKHAESPAAKKHKSEYDTKYESTPDRIKYRTELTQERRKRHVDGKGGKDMSHTASGKIVPEDMHANRARHFKERGTLKKTVFVKQQCPTPSKKAYSNGEEAHQDASMMGGGLGVYQCPCGAYHFTSNQ